MNRGNKKVEVQGNEAVNKLGNRRRDWGNSEHRNINNLEETKFSEDSEDSCIEDYEYVSKEIQEEKNFGDCKYVGDGNWDHKAQGFGEGYKEEPRYLGNLEEAKFSEGSEDSCIKDYKYAFKEVHEEENFGDCEYVDDGNWEHKTQEFDEDYAQFL